jgi:phosphatidylserine decarboxylase
MNNQHDKPTGEPAPASAPEGEGHSHKYRHRQRRRGGSAEPPPLPEPPAGPLPLVPGESAKYRLPDMHPEGRKFVGLALVAVLVSGLWLQWTALSFILLGITIWVAAFFRDPVRVTPLGEGLIVSPADGLISLITNVEVPRQLLGEGGLEPGQMTRVSVFMNVFDVHVNRAPVAGRMTRIVYVPGKFLNADLDKASDENERQYFVMEMAAACGSASPRLPGWWRGAS